MIFLCKMKLKAHTFQIKSFLPPSLGSYYLVSRKLAPTALTKRFDVPVWGYGWKGSTCRMKIMFSFSESLARLLFSTARVCPLDKFPPLFLRRKKSPHFFEEMRIFRISRRKNEGKNAFCQECLPYVRINVSKTSQMFFVTYWRSFESLWGHFEAVWAQKINIFTFWVT